MPRIVAVIVCVLLAVAVCAAPAAAKKKGKKTGLGKVVTATAQATPGAEGQAASGIATCPPGTAVVGGGFQTPPATVEQSFIVDASYRSSARTWTVLGLQYDGDFSPVTAYAYCRRGTKPITDVAGTGTIPGGYPEPGTAAATCPAGTQLVAGGFQTTRGSTFGVGRAFMNLSTAPGVWTVASGNNGNTPLTLTAHAYCMKGVRAPTLVNSSTSGFAPTNTSLTSASPACPTPAGKKSAGAAKKKKKKKRKRVQRMSAGGFSSPTPAAPGVVPTYTESRLGSGNWTNTAFNYQDNGTLAMLSQGICL